MVTALKPERQPASPEHLGEGVPQSRAARLREMLRSSDLRFIMEAHNGLSAKIVEEAGFEGIWASGLSVSAALGVRDSNEASWTQILEVLEFMADATRIPILVDGDTGYGNFNNFRRLVQKLCQRGIAGVCIEDKLFPKTNSFLGSNQPLADIDEFCGKIKAGKDSQTDPAFNIVARIEALISGWGMDEALRRAEAFHAAGADALVIHSKKSGAEEILTFCREWGNRCPVIVIPTTYYRTPTDRFREVGVSTIIWANHNLRVAIQSMRELCRRLRQEETLIEIEDMVAPLGDVFKLAGNAELEQAEDRYLAKHKAAGAILLAATRGSALGELTREKPKCMLDVRGTSILQRHVAALRNHGIGEIAVVTGYKAEAVNLAGIKTVRNAAYETTGEAASLALAKDKLTGACVIGYGDIVYRHFVLSMLLDCEADIAVVVDAGWKDRHESGAKKGADLARCSVPFTADFLDDAPVTLTAIGAGLAEVDGEWVGLMKVSEKGAARLALELDRMAADGSLATASLPDLLQRLIAAGERPAVVYITGNWLDVNDAFDLAQARNVT
jgi:phosphoenolpyruvate phosphomutase